MSDLELADVTSTVDGLFSGPFPETILSRSRRQP